MPTDATNAPDRRPGSTPGTFLGFARRYWLVQLVLLVAIVTPMALIAAFSLGNADRQLVEQTLARRQAAAYLAAATLRERFDRFAGIASSLAGQPAFLAAVRAGRWADAAKTVSSVPLEQPDIDRVVIADAAGAVRAAVPPSTDAEGEDLSSQEWFTRLVADRAPVVSDVHARGTDRINVVSVAVPVPSDRDEALAAALVLEIRTDTLLAWARGIDVGLASTAYFVDRQGNLAAHPKYSAQGPVRNFRDHPGVVDLLRGKGGTRFATYEGEEMIVATEPVKEYGWGVAVEQPKAMAFAPREEYLKPIVVSYAVILVVNLLLALGILRMARKNLDGYERERGYLAGIGDGIVAVDTEGNVIRTNPQAETLLGWRSEELQGKPFIDLVPLQDESGAAVPATFRPLVYALKSGQKKTVTTTPTYYYVRKDGVRFPMAATATPLFEDGKVAGAILVFRDIKAEKEVDAAKSEFVSLASHQLLSPAGAVKGYIHLLNDGDLGPLEPRQKVVVGKAIFLMDRMIGLVDTLLNVSRIELGTFSVRPVPTDLRKLAQGIIAELTPKFQEKDIQLSEFFDVDLPLLNVDPNLANIVLQNLLTNAVRYSPKGGQVAFSIEQRPSFVVVTVADKGMGIPREQQAKIFTKFFRADNARGAVPDGNGLGLYIVRSIVEQGGGRIWFTSQEGKGTTFYVTIPLSGMKPREGSKALGLTE